MLEVHAKAHVQVFRGKDLVDLDTELRGGQTAWWVVHVGNGKVGTLEPRKRYDKPTDIQIQPSALQHGDGVYVFGVSLLEFGTRIAVRKRGNKITWVDYATCGIQNKLIAETVELMNNEVNL